MLNWVVIMIVIVAVAMAVVGGVAVGVVGRVVSHRETGVEALTKPLGQWQSNKRTLCGLFKVRCDLRFRP